MHIAQIGVAGWRARYDASAVEVLDLLDFTRVRSRSLLRTLLETGNVTVELPAITASLPAWTGPLTLKPARDDPQPARMAVYAGDKQIATVAAQDHADLSAILDTGLAIIVKIDDRSYHPALSITLPLADATD